ncbi:DMT family transporter [bacterium]|nr:DMT family transporter [bacterium]
MKKNSHILPYAALAIAMLAWGFSFIFTKVALTGFSTYSLVFFRFSITALFFIGLLLKKGFPRLSLKNHLRLFVIGLFQPWLYFLFETNGLQYTTASKASLITATIPIGVLLLSVAFLKEKPKFNQVAGIALSITGMAILIGGDPGFQWDMNQGMMGDFLILGAVVSASIFTVLIRSAGQYLSTVDITGIQVIWGAILFAPEFFWEYPSIDWSLVTFYPILAIAGLCLFATIGAFLCFNFALSKIEAVKASVFLNGIPVVTAIGAWLILDESLTWIQLFGGAIILIAVYLANLKKSRQKSALNLQGKIAQDG